MATCKDHTQQVALRIYAILLPMHYGTMKLCEVLLTALVLCALIYTALCVVCWAVKLNVFVPPSPAHCCLSPMSPVTPPPTLWPVISYIGNFSPGSCCNHNKQNHFCITPHMFVLCVTVCFIITGISQVVSGTYFTSHNPDFTNYAISGVCAG